MEESSSNKRPSWDEYFMDILKAVSKRGLCDRGYPAAVLVRDNRVIATAYGGAPSGLPDCNEVGHELIEMKTADGNTSKHCVRGVHAELNTIIQCARFGVSTEGTTVYISFEPCYTCAKAIINAGIKRVVCQTMYHGASRSREILKQCGIKLDVIEEKMQEYKDMK